MSNPSETISEGLQLLAQIPPTITLYKTHNGTWIVKACVYKEGRSVYVKILDRVSTFELYEWVKKGYP